MYLPFTAARSWKIGVWLERAPVGRTGELATKGNDGSGVEEVVVLLGKQWDMTTSLLWFVHSCPSLVPTYPTVLGADAVCLDAIHCVVERAPRKNSLIATLGRGMLAVQQ